MATEQKEVEEKEEEREEEVVEEKEKKKEEDAEALKDRSTQTMIMTTTKMTMRVTKITMLVLLHSLHYVQVPLHLLLPSRDQPPSQPIPIGLSHHLHHRYHQYP